MRSVIVILTALLATAAVAAPPPSEIQLSLGSVMPLGEFDDDDLAKNGFSLSGSYGVYLSPRFQLGFGLGHMGTDADDKIDADLWHYNRRFAVLKAEIFGKWLLVDRLSSPYVHARVGAYRWTERVLARYIDGTATPIYGPLRAESTEFGYGFGGGVQIRAAGGSSMFIETTWQHIARDYLNDWEFLEVRAGIAIDLSGPES